MRHRVDKKRLGSKKTNQRKALLRSLVTSLVLFGTIKTTKSRGFELTRYFEKLVSSILNTEEKREKIKISKKVIFSESAQKIFLEKIVPSFTKKKSGFLKKVAIANRSGDNAAMVQLQILSD